MNLNNRVLYFINSYTPGATVAADNTNELLSGLWYECMFEEFCYVCHMVEPESTYIQHMITITYDHVPLSS